LPVWRLLAADRLEALVTVRFLADKDLDSDIIEGLRSREPAIDILNAKKTSLRGTKDPDLSNSRHARSAF
jgi:hypothetical protein